MSELRAAPAGVIEFPAAVMPPEATVYGAMSGRVSENMVAVEPWVSNPGFWIRFVAASAPAGDSTAAASRELANAAVRTRTNGIRQPFAIGRVVPSTLPLNPSGAPCPEAPDRCAHLAGERADLSFRDYGVAAV